MYNKVFNNIRWLDKFTQKTRCNELRAEIYQQTVEIVHSGGYVLNGKEIAVNKTGIAVNTEFFDTRFSLKDMSQQHDTNFSVIEANCLDVAELEEVGGKLRIAQHLIEPAKEKMRTILRIAGKYHHNALVLSAFGCGAFCNPPEHIALLFKEVFAEPEFKSRFAMVVFAIISDQNSNRAHNPNGNFEPFRKVF